MGNLPFDIEDSDIRQFFKDFKNIEYIRIVRDKFSH